ncbi:MAG: hypothetical protein D6675_09495, partial [Gemmatimonadetes bacterium]
MKHLLIFTALLSLIFSGSSFARNCGTMDVHEHLLQTDPKYAENIEQIEAFTAARIAELERTGHMRVNGVITIPVNVIVVYSNSQQNISDAQIQSQI